MASSEEKYTALEEGAGAASKDLEKGANAAIPVVTANPTVYLNVPSLTASDKKRLNVPFFCDGGCHYCSIVFLCCLVTIIAPLVLVFAIAPVFLNEDNGGAQAAIAVGITLAVVGLLWFCCMSSWPDFIKEGVCCMPKGVEPVATWSDDAASKKETVKVKKLKVIVNPNAGLKRGLSNLSICKKVWEAKGIEVIVVNTTHAGHAREIGREEDLEGIDALVAIGGDGTLHETINGFLSRETPSSVPLGFIPGGSGNSIMAHLGTWSVQEAAERIASGETNFIDVNTVTTCGETLISANLIAFGLVGWSGVLAEDYRWMGPARYNVVAVWKMMTGIREQTKCHIEDKNGKAYQFEDNYVTFYINKTQHFGKGLRGAPYAQQGNGLMEVYAIKSTVSRGSQVASLQQVPTASHQSNPAIAYKQAKKCVITLPGPGVFNLDGEAVRHDGKVEVECLKQHLKIFTPLGTYPHNL